MQSATFVSTLPLNNGSSFPASVIFESVLNYNQYFITLFSDTSVKIKIYQSNDAGVKSNMQMMSYPGGTSRMISGSITGSHISFVITNSSGTNQTQLNFSVVYK